MMPTTEAGRAWVARNRDRINAQQRELRSTPEAKEKAAAQMREYRKTQKNIEYRKAYRQANKERNSAQHAAWVAANPERAREHSKKSYDKHREVRIADSLAWQRANPEKAKLRDHRYRARKVAASGVVSENILDILFSEQGGSCPYCLGKLDRKSMHLDHFVPFALGGRHEDDNLQLLCPTCNCRKRHSDPQEYLARVLREHH